MKNFPLLLVAVVCLAALACARDYRPLVPRPSVAGLVALLSNAASPEERWRLAGGFHEALRGQPALYPPFEDGKVHFFVWDETGRAQPGLAIARTEWVPAALPFRRLFGTPLLHLALPVTDGADFVYYIADGSQWRRDSLNPLEAPDPLFSLASRVELVRRTAPAWAWRRPDLLRGKLLEKAIRSPWLGYRRAWLYLPPRALAVDELVVMPLSFSAAELPLVQNLLDNAWSGVSGGRAAVFIEENTAVDHGAGAYAFAEMALNEARGCLAGEIAVTKACRILLATAGPAAGQAVLGLLRGSARPAVLCLRRPEWEANRAYIAWQLNRIAEGSTNLTGIRVSVAGIGSGQAIVDGLRARGAAVSLSVMPEGGTSRLDAMFGLLRQVNTVR